MTGTDFAAALPIGQAPTVAVLMVARGGGESTLAAVRSIVENTVGRCAMFVWDDNSKDDTPDKLRTLEGEFGNVVVLESQRKRGIEFALSEMRRMFPSSPLVALVHQEAILPYGWNVKMAWRYRQIYRHGAVVGVWDGQRFKDTPLCLADNPDKPLVIPLNGVGAISRKPTRIERDRQPVVMVAASVVRSSGIPHDLSVRYEIVGRPVVAMPEIVCRRSGSGRILVAQGG